MKSSFYKIGFPRKKRCSTETAIKVNSERPTTVEPRFNEVAGDRPHLFVKSRVRYIENLDITNLSGNDQNIRYIEVIVNDWFVTQVTSVTQFNAIFVTQKCRVLRCNSLSMVAFSHSRPQSLRFFWSRGRRNGRLPLVNDIKPEDEWLWGREWLSVAIISNFEQTLRSFCLQKTRFSE